MALFVQSLGALGGISRSLFVPFLRNHLCGEDIEVASQIPKLYQRVHGELFGCWCRWLLEAVASKWGSKGPIVLLAKFGRQQFNKEWVTVDGEYSIRIFGFHNDNHHNASRFKRKERHASHGLPRSTVSLVMSLLTQQFLQTTAGHTQVRNKGKFSRQYTNYQYTFFLITLD